MKASIIAAIFAATAAAAPIEVEKRQLGTGTTSNELENGACKDVIFIFARGSTEPGNMGLSVGPPTCRGLKRAFNQNVACQGVGGRYNAGLVTNAYPGGTTPAAINEAKGLMEKAAQKCPNAQIVVAGYSQGAAVINGAVKDLDESVKSRVAGAVLYGNTRNAQTNGHIPDYPDERSETICNAGDGVCHGTLIVTAGHLTYNADVSKAVKFLEERVEANGGPGTAASDGEVQGAIGDGSDASYGDLSPGLSLGGSSDSTSSTTDDDSSSGLGGFSIFGK